MKEIIIDLRHACPALEDKKKHVPDVDIPSDYQARLLPEQESYIMHTCPAGRQIVVTELADDSYTVPQTAVTRTVEVTCQGCPLLKRGFKKQFQAPITNYPG